ncbi:MAG: GNAT family N-acetyltransferase, partial [Promethearchaeota archaeon]
MEYEKLSNEHDLSNFNCGDNEINDYLRQIARKYQKRRLSTTYLAIENGNIIGYLSLSFHHIKDKDRKIANPTLETRWGDYPPFISCLFVDMIGVDNKYRGRGCGTEFLREIIRIADEINEFVSIRFILLEAVPNSLEFYYKNGFSILFQNDNINRLEKYSEYGIYYKIENDKRQINIDEETYKK